MCVFVLRQTSPSSPLPPLYALHSAPYLPPYLAPRSSPPSVIQSLPTRDPLSLHTR